MSRPGEDGTHEDSIKPVSSLRSLFERKASVEAGAGTVPTLPSPKPPPRPRSNFDQARDDGHAPMRASLDVPRTSSPWSSPDVVVDPQRKGTQGPPVPRPRRPASRILQRPLSTTSLSTPRSPPMVTVDAPTSPPKLSQSSSIYHAQLSQAPGPFTPIGASSASTHGLSSHLKSPTRTSATESQMSVATPNVGFPERRQAPRSIDDLPTRIFTKSVPPPVNRADKPKIPSKPTSILSKTNLEPSLPVANERVSPFSTPPSSDESTGAGGGEKTGRNEPTVGAKEFRNFKGNETLRSKGSPPNEETTSTKGRTSPVRRQRLDARALGFSQAIGASNLIEETPPGLPPRREHHQRAKSSREADFPTYGREKAANPPFSNKPNQFHASSEPASNFLPPPKRDSMPVHRYQANAQDPRLPRRIDHDTEAKITHEGLQVSEQEPDLSISPTPGADYPDSSSINRRPPFIKVGAEEIYTNYDTRLVDICGRYVVTTGHSTKIWDVSSGELVTSLNHAERETRVTSLAFKPAATANEEGSDIWLGTNYGEIQELKISSQSIVFTKAGAHERREIVKIHRFQSSMWTLDDGGRLCVWEGDDTGLPDLKCFPKSHRVPRGYTFSLVVQDCLWLATGKDIRIFRPNANDAATFSVLQEPLNQVGVGPITSGTTVGSQLDRVYFGHTDGKVTIYSITDFTCLGIMNVSNYKISCLAGAGSLLWAGFGTGMVHVYDTQQRPWMTRKEWLAHGNPILNVLVDRSSLWKDGILRVVSLGADSALRFWDGVLETDWLENYMHSRDIDYCSFRELTALVITWNAGAATPAHLRHDERGAQFFRDILQTNPSPDLLVYGFQELVDLEDKKLTAKTLFKGNKKKDPSEQEHISRQYRAWRDYLIRCIEDSVPSDEPYHLVHTASMVGLFSCVLIRASLRNQIRNLSAVEVKRGMGGLHGNKGALILRFILDDSSICLVNCHLAAGQTQTASRNSDITAILESSILPANHHSSMVSDTFVCGGDGCMILDHEICILNGDLNYRIDTMGRDTVVKAVNANNLAKLLERDQLLVSRRRNPGFRVRAFMECPITFAPTYKYDVGTDRYDTSEKRRAPAWCDRILYRGPGKIKQVDYRRHEIRVSDHRPVSGRFKLRIKAIDAGQRESVWKNAEANLKKAREELAKEAKVQYLRDVLGVPPNEAKRLI